MECPIAPTASNLNHPHLHARQVQGVEPGEESHLNRTAAIYECFQVIALPMHPGIWVRQIQVAEKRQPRT